MKRMAIWLAILGLGSGVLFSQSVNLKIGLFVPQHGFRPVADQHGQPDLQQVRHDQRLLRGRIRDLSRPPHLLFPGDRQLYARASTPSTATYQFEDGSPIFQNISAAPDPGRSQPQILPHGPPLPVFPFIGVGAGVYAWTYQQWGDFINFEDNSVNEGFAETRSFAFGLNGRVGLVFRFHPRLAFALEGKYQYLKGRLSEYFQGFDQLDLGGFTANVSINIYFR